MNERNWINRFLEVEARIQVRRHEIQFLQKNHANRTSTTQPFAEFIIENRIRQCRTDGWLVVTSLTWKHVNGLPRTIRAEIPQRLFLVVHSCESAHVNLFHFHPSYKVALTCWASGDVLSLRFTNISLQILTVSQ